MRVIFAGMPSFNLTDAASLRLQSISFFVVVFLLAALAVRFVWNALRSDFPKLPRLSYPKALGLVGLWGLLFLLVLTMISGARELMTPGAWKKDGVTYTLADGKPAPPPPVAATEKDRESKLRMLAGVLAAYAASHDGRYPPAITDPAVPPAAWTLPELPSVKYVYAAGLTTRDGSKLLACEPAIYDNGRFVLLADGTLKLMTHDEVAPLLGSGAK